ncbi:hypothetical protein OQJ13_13110 [Legionella sp. PATHC035]|uniref:hypothetical protein n=1 Tax=Legionella sp. PATHC035 TaxID=2992040 RepID=UPI0022438E1C|nr:hypothetical protein [Legionella sp. PATHC035]MCW8409912.1 hypothetical protein [Legionella sp. PATHC035]
MKIVVIGIKRSKSTVNVMVTFDDDPFEFLDESDKPKNAQQEQEQLISLAQSIVANKIIEHEINFSPDIANQALRTHVLISGKKEGVLQVRFTNPSGISVLEKPPSLQGLLKERLGTVALTSTYSEISALQTLALPHIPYLQLLQEDKKRATNAKEERDLAKKKEDFLANGPSEFPAPKAFPVPRNATAEKDIDLKKAVEKLSALYGTESQLNSILKQIETVEEEIKALDTELTELKKKEAVLKETMGTNTVVSFAEGHLQTSKSELEKARMELENTLSTLRENFSKVKSSFEKHVKSNYAQYEIYENGQEFAKQVMLTALYNAALDYYDKLLKDTEKKPEIRKNRVKDFNKYFGGIAIIDEYGKVNSIEETYNSFANKTLGDVVEIANEVIKITEPKFIDKWLAKANTHWENNSNFNNLLYRDESQKIPFKMERSFAVFGSGTLQKINLNTKFESNIESHIQKASDPTNLDAPQTKLTELEQKVTNFQRYRALKAELEATKVLASKQKNQIDEATETFNKTRDSIVNQIKGQPEDVQKHVLQNINSQLAKSVLNELPEANKKLLITVLPELTKIPEKSEIELLAEKYAVLANEIATAVENLNQIKKEDIQVEQLNQLRSALDKVKESQLDERNMEKVIELRDSYTKDDLSVDSLIFQQQLFNAKKILAEQIRDVEKKFESIKQANKEWLTTFESERQSLNRVANSFDEIDYQHKQSEQNKAELQRLTELATRSYMNILSEYEQIIARIKLAQGSQTVEVPVTVEAPQRVIPEQADPPETVRKKNKTPPPEISETPPTPNKGAISRSKPESTIEARIRAIYENYFKEVRVETQNLSQKDSSTWQELFTVQNAEGSLEEFKIKYIKEQESKIKEEKAVASLDKIINLIEETQWKTGLLGSKSKIKINDKERPVPKHICEIYKKAIEGRDNPQQADEAMSEINAIATKAISHSVKFQFLRKRDEQTQEAYDAIEAHSKPLGKFVP